MSALSHQFCSLLYRHFHYILLHLLDRVRLYCTSFPTWQTRFWALVSRCLCRCAEVEAKYFFALRTICLYAFHFSSLHTVFLCFRRPWRHWRGTFHTFHRLANRSTCGDRVERCLRRCRWGSFGTVDQLFQTVRAWWCRLMSSWTLRAQFLCTSNLPQFSGLTNVTSIGCERFRPPTLSRGAISV